MSVNEHGDKPKRGRPKGSGKYHPGLIPSAKKLASIGLTDAEIAEYFEVNKATLTRWLVEYPDFCATLKEAKQIADKRVVRRLFERALGYTSKETKRVEIEGKPARIITITKEYPPDTTACIFWLKNRDPESWRDKIDVEHKHQFNFIGMLPSREEWNKKYASNPEPLTIEVRPNEVTEDEDDPGKAGD
jgi:hypothetical protein